MIQYWLYKQYDKDGNLLYIGVSGEVTKRIHSHLRRSSWGHLVRRIEVEPIGSDRDEAYRIEKQAIGDLHPPYNRLHVEGYVLIKSLKREAKLLFDYQRYRSILIDELQDTPAAHVAKASGLSSTAISRILAQPDVPSAATTMQKLKKYALKRRERNL
jgi:hypothetical protein